jgi:hypothetical protein
MKPRGTTFVKSPILSRVAGRRSTLWSAWLIAILSLGVAGGRAQPSVEAWVQRYSGPGNFHDVPYAMAVDGRGNVVVTGTSYFSGSSNDYATVAYSAAGVPLWTNYYNGPGNGEDRASAVVVDRSGNAVVAGVSYNGVEFDYATIAYSQAGLPLWTNRYSGVGNNYDDYGVQVPSMAVDGRGNVIVTGYAHSDWTNSHYVTIQYSGAGVAVWTNRYRPSNDVAHGYAVAVDRSGNVFVTGTSGNGLRRPGSGYQAGYATIAYSGAGVPLWTNRYNGRGGFGAADPAAIAVDGEGNAIVTGTSNDDFDGARYVTVKYSGAGTALWTNVYPSRGFDFRTSATAMAVDGSGNVFVTGYVFGDGGSYDYATVAYSGTGAQLWTNFYDGLWHGDDYASAVAADNSGNVFVTGYENFGQAYATIAYSVAGVPLWTNRYSGGGPNLPLTKSSLAVSPDGAIYVTGASGGNGYDFATVKYVMPRLSIARAGGKALMVSWPLPFADYVLQYNNDLGTTNWMEKAEPPMTNATSQFILVTPSMGQRFYRLRKP